MHISMTLQSLNKWAIIAPYLIIVNLILLYVFSFPLSFYNDSFVYLSGARNIAKGIGFYTLNPSFINIQNPLVPITDWQPGYSFFLAFVMKVFNFSVIKSVYIVNLISWTLFHLFSALIFFKLFKSKIQIIATLVLITTCGFMWQFLRYPLSDILFFAITSIFLYTIILFNETQHKVNQGILLLLLSFLATLILLTRYAGIAFIAPYFVFLISQKTKSIKIKIVETSITSIVILTIFLIWYFRNKMVSEGGGMDFWITEGIKNVFTFSRFLDIMNYFTMAIFSIPGRFLNFGFLIFVPLFLFIAFLVSTFKFNLLNKLLKQPVYLLIVLMIFFYFSEVTLMGLLNSEVNYKGGFLRYFTYLQPMVLIVILAFLNIKTHYSKIFKYYVISIFIIISIAGTIKTFVFLKNLSKDESEYVIISKTLKKNVNTGDLIISNIPMAIYAQTGFICHEIRKTDELKNLICKFKKSENNKTLLVLQKVVGTSFRLNEDSWEKYKTAFMLETIEENESYIIFKMKN